MNKTLTTVLIPLRVDSVERLENLLCVIKYLIKLDLYIFIYEADYNNNGIVSKLLPRTKKILWYVLKISFQLFLVDFGVDLGARPQGHSELWPKGLSPKMPKSNKNNGR